MQLKINEKFPVEFSEAGTYISFEDNTFYARLWRMNSGQILN